MIKRFFLKLDLDRSQRTNYNIVLSIFFKGVTILLQFALIPLTIGYIKPDAYGVWLTLSSLVGWGAIFDIGIGNGLRNKLSESLSQNDFRTSKIYVSTAYAIITVIAIILIGLYFMTIPFINWQSVFNSNFIPEKELTTVVTIVSLCFLLKLITDIINVVAASFQMVSISSILLFISNLGLIIGVWILTKSTGSNLVLLALCLSFIPFLISVLANIYLFSSKFKSVSPSFRLIDFKQSKSVIGLGAQFFILQIITLILFQTDNILIDQLFKPSDVTNFNVSYKYYSVIMILFTIILAPYWTAFTEAYYKKDFLWIRISVNKLVKYWALSIVVLLIMILSAGFVLKLWVGNSISVSLPLSISICCYITIFNWNAIFSNFLNGVGKIRLQIFIAIIMGIINIPFSIFLVKSLKWGVYAMPASNFMCLSVGGGICFVQYLKLINNEAKGIWDK